MHDMDVVRSLNRPEALFVARELGPRYQQTEDLLNSGEGEELKKQMYIEANSAKERRNLALKNGAMDEKNKEWLSAALCESFYNCLRVSDAKISSRVFLEVSVWLNEVGYFSQVKIEEIAHKTVIEPVFQNGLISAYWLLTDRDGKALLNDLESIDAKTLFVNTIEKRIATEDFLDLQNRNLGFQVKGVDGRVARVIVDNENKIVMNWSRSAPVQ